MQPSENIFLLHGFLGTRDDWEPLLPHFTSRYNCFAIDLPGHGSSPYSENILETIKAEIEKISSPPIVIGYSLGGRIALQLAALYPHLFKAVIALSSHPGLQTHQEKQERLAIDQKWAEELLSLPLPTFLSNWYAQSIFQSLQDRPELLTQLIEKRSTQNPQLLSRVLLQLSLSKQPLLLPSLPTLFLYGEKDLKYAALYRRLSPFALGIKESGHLIHLENPRDCASEIYTFIERLYDNG